MCSSIHNFKTNGAQPLDQGNGLNPVGDLCLKGIPVKKATSGHKGISRIDHEQKHTHGWYVRVCFDRRMHAKFFSDATNGGKEKALETAIEYRNNLEASLGKPRTDRIVVVSNARNHTGVIGVQRIVRPGPADPENPLKGMAFEVTWSPEPNVLRKISFPVEKYGEAEAFQLAVEFRQAREKEIFGKVIQTEIPPYEQVRARLEALSTAARKKSIRRKKGTRPITSRK